MPATSRPPFSLLTWLLAAALLLSVGANLYWLLPQYRSERLAAAADASARTALTEDDDEEEDDASWATLTAELRQARQQLAKCRAGHAPAAPPAADR